MGQMLKVGITGAAGVLGTVLRKGLRSKYELHSFDVKNIEEGSEDNFKRCDFADENEINGIFDGLDAVLHLAGDPRPDAPVELTKRNNFKTTSLIFEEARKSGVKKIVFASSNFYHQGDIRAALQGRLGRKITLDMMPTPECMYAMSKVYGESLGLHYSNFGIKFAGIRIGWTIREDNPSYYGGIYMASMFCSHRDLVQAFDKAIECDEDFVTAFAISNNDARVFDLAETREKLGFEPLDNSAKY